MSATAEKLDAPTRSPVAITRPDPDRPTFAAAGRGALVAAEIDRIDREAEKSAASTPG